MTENGDKIEVSKYGSWMRARAYDLKCNLLGELRFKEGLVSLASVSLSEPCDFSSFNECIALLVDILNFDSEEQRDIEGKTITQSESRIPEVKNPDKRVPYYNYGITFLNTKEGPFVGLISEEDSDERIKKTVEFLGLNDQIIVFLSGTTTSVDETS